MRTFQLKSPLAAIAESLKYRMIFSSKYFQLSLSTRFATFHQSETVLQRPLVRPFSLGSDVSHRRENYKAPFPDSLVDGKTFEIELSNCKTVADFDALHARVKHLILKDGIAQPLYKLHACWETDVASGAKPPSFTSLPSVMRLLEDISTMLDPDVWVKVYGDDPLLKADADPKYRDPPKIDGKAVPGKDRIWRSQRFASQPPFRHKPVRLRELTRVGFYLVEYHLHHSPTGRKIFTKLPSWQLPFVPRMNFAEVTNILFSLDLGSSNMTISALPKKFLFNLLHRGNELIHQHIASIGKESGRPPMDPFTLIDLARSSCSLANLGMLTPSDASLRIRLFVHFLSLPTDTPPKMLLESISFVLHSLVILRIESSFRRNVAQPVNPDSSPRVFLDDLDKETLSKLPLSLQMDAKTVERRIYDSLRSLVPQVQMYSYIVDVASVSQAFGLFELDKVFEREQAEVENQKNGQFQPLLSIIKDQVSIIASQLTPLQLDGIVQRMEQRELDRKRRSSLAGTRKTLIQTQTNLDNEKE
jgi:hypothetical protein